MKTILKLASSVEKTLRSEFIRRSGLKLRDLLNLNPNSICLQNANYRKILSSTRDIRGIPSSDKTDVLLVVLYQGVRLAALLHDIGHPPFSHIVEYGLQQSLGHKSRTECDLSYGNHEEITQDLFQIIMDEFKTQKLPPYIPNNRPFVLASFCIAKALIFKPKQNGKQKKTEKPYKDELSGLRDTLFSGDVDADRLDYVKRDIDASGIALSSYDMGRIYDSAVLRENPENENYVEVGLTTGCLSALEAFFQSRFHLYRWVIYHHDVVRRNLAVQRTIVTLLSAEESDLNDDLIPIKRSFIDVSCNPDSRQNYAEFTDGYFVQMLWKIFNSVKESIESRPIEQRDLHLFCDLILNRKNWRMRSLWKRPDQYGRLCDIILKRKNEAAQGDKISVFNKMLGDFFDSRYYDQFGKSVGRFEFARDLENEINTKLQSEANTRVFAYYFGKFEPGPSESFYLSGSRGGTEKVVVDSVSPTLAALRNAWQSSPQLMLFHEVNSASETVDRDELARQYMDATLKALKSLIKKPQ